MAVAPGAGAFTGGAAGSFGAGGSAFMMLTGGIEAAEGKSYLLDSGCGPGGAAGAVDTSADGGTLATGAGLSAFQAAA